MHKVLSIFLVFIFSLRSAGQDKQIPDTVYTGIYVTSIHDIDFRQKEYTTTFWLWLKYKNKEFDFLQNLEVPQAKSVNRSFSTIDSSNNKIYILMKLQCVMKDSWKIDRFPFDKQKLRLSLENSQFDSKSLIFKPDTLGKHYDPRFTLNGWTIESFKVSSKIKEYETAFGDEDAKEPHSEYSSFRVNIGLERHALGLFWKMFLGMYVAFFIAFVCFFIHNDYIDSRFGLGVGALFAVVGNKYVVDSSLPESSSFTLVDTLHGITLIFIFVITAFSVYILSLVKNGGSEKAARINRQTAAVTLFIYILLNIYYIWSALKLSMD